MSDAAVMVWIVMVSGPVALILFFKRKRPSALQAPMREPPRHHPGGFDHPA